MGCLPGAFTSTIASVIYSRVLSGPNTEAEPSASPIELVDVEQLCAPGVARPLALPAGSPGYAHRTAAAGLWQPEGDRFAGAVLLAELLGWCDEPVREAAWGESYFAPDELQGNGEHRRTLAAALDRRWGSAVAALFQRAWDSETLADCPTFGEWLVSLPESVAPAGSASPQPPSAVQNLLAAGEELERAGDLSAALACYQRAVSLAPAGSVLAEEAARRVRALQPGDVTQPVDPEELAVSRWFAAGQAAIARADWPAARELLQAVVARRPGYAAGGVAAATLLAQVERHLAPVRPGWRQRAARWRDERPLSALAVAALAALLILGGGATLRRVTQAAAAVPPAKHVTTCVARILPVEGMGGNRRVDGRTDGGATGGVGACEPAGGGARGLAGAHGAAE